jgi:hypothetical protein
MISGTELVNVTEGTTILKRMLENSSGWPGLGPEEKDPWPQLKWFELMDVHVYCDPTGGSTQDEHIASKARFCIATLIRRDAIRSILHH